MKSISKAAFVRRHGNRSAKDVVALAKKQGLTLKEAYVYNVRNYDNKKRAKVVGHVARTAPTSLADEKAVASKRSVGTAKEHRGRLETLLIALASDIGLSKSVEILTAEREGVRKVLERT